MNDTEMVYKRPATSTELSGIGLDRLACAAGPATRWYIAENPATPAATIDRLCSDPDRFVAGMALSRTTNAAILDDAAASTTLYIRKAASANPAISEANVEALAATTDRSSLVALLSNPAMTDTFAHILADQIAERDEAFFTKNRPTRGADIIAIVDAHPGVAAVLEGRWKVIDRILAGCCGLDHSFYLKLTAGAGANTMDALAGNPSVPDDMLNARGKRTRAVAGAMWFDGLAETLAADPTDHRVLLAATTTPSIARALAHHPSRDPAHVAAAIAATTFVQTDPRVLRSLARRSRWGTTAKRSTFSYGAMTQSSWESFVPAMTRYVSRLAIDKALPDFDDWSHVSETLGDDVAVWDLYWVLVGDGGDPGEIAAVTCQAAR